MKGQTMTKLEEIKEIINEQPAGMTVRLPVSAVEYLLERKNDADRLRKEKQYLQNQLRYYKDMYPATVKEARLLRKELNRMRKERASDGKANPQGEMQ